MRFAILLGFLSSCIAAQTMEDEYRVYTEHPRLFLGAQRLKLLKRERDRQSMRWRQFETLVKASSQMPEPGFALALYYSVTGDAGIGKRAVDWAQGPGADLRQLALVYDWCQNLLTPAQSKALAAKIQRAVQSRTPSSLAARRDRVLAAIAIASDGQHSEESLLRDTVERWWRGQMAPALLDGRTTIPLADAYALLEVLHAVRDNTNVEMRHSAAAYFKELPKYQILGNYPAPYPAPENEYRVPLYRSAGQPDLHQAALARAAGLSMVAYDNNALENQFLQGWLIQDRFMMQGAFGAPYEFLWANPYQPGLSYFHLPLIFHDPRTGTLLLRSSWDEDAIWFGLFENEAQLFRQGKITVLNQKGPLASKPKPIEVGVASVIQGRNPLRFSIDGEMTFVVGLKPRHAYLVEADDEEMRELETDAAGTLVLQFPAERTPEVRMKELTVGRAGT